MARPLQLAHLQDCQNWWHQHQEGPNAWRVDIDQIKARNYNLDIKNPWQEAEEQHNQSNCWKN